MKTVLGKSGPFDGDDVLDLLLARPDTARHLTAKLWREFVSPDPDPVEVQRIAARFAESRYDIKVALREILLCDTFYAAENRGVLVKSPAELVVGTLRTFGIEPEQALAFAIATAVMGQSLMAPPNVKGWPGGEAWINTTTLLARKQFVDRIARADGMSTPSGRMAYTRSAKADRALERGLSSLHFDSARFMSQFPGASPDERARWAQRLLLPVAPQSTDEPPGDATAIVHGLVLDTAYQLK